MDSVKELIYKELCAFNENISFSYSGSPDALLREVVTEHPDARVYVHAFTSRQIGRSCALKILYHNKDILRKNIFVASSEAECMRLMCESAESCRASIAIIPRFRTGIVSVYQKFIDMYMTFYPNLMTLGYGWCESIANDGCADNNWGFVWRFIFNYRLGRAVLDVMERRVDREVESLSKKLFLAGMPTSAKIYLAHNYLAATVEYLMDRSTKYNASHTQSAYGAFVDRRCVCQGYAEAFKRLMDHEGIDCYMACGTTDSERDSYHAWNIVSVGEGKGYLHVDVTWDARREDVDYTYFAKNDGFFSGKREWHRELLPVCEARANVVNEARAYLRENKARLISNGIAAYIIDC